MFYVKMNFLYNGRVIIRTYDNAENVSCAISNINNTEELVSIVDNILNNCALEMTYDEFCKTIHKIGITDVELDALPEMIIRLSDSDNENTVINANAVLYEMDKNSNDRYLSKIIAEDIKEKYYNLREECIEKEIQTDTLADIEFMIASVKSGRKIPLRRILKQLDDIRLNSMSDNRLLRDKTRELIMEIHEKKG